jgi:hypothetical protein
VGSESRVIVVGIVTHDRLSTLVSCLESCLANCRRHRRTAEVVVMNDGCDVDVRSAPAIIDFGMFGDARVEPRIGANGN